MANIKFSAFTQKVASADVDFIVGYTGTDNIRIAPSVLDDRYVLKTGDTMTGALQMGASFAAQTPISFGDANFQISTENNYTAANLDNLKFKVPDAATGGFRFTNANDDEIFFAQGDGKIGVNTVTPQKTLDVSLGGNTGIGASFGGTISTGEYQGIHVGYSEAGNTKYRKSAIVFERDDSATGNAQGNIYILNNVENNDTSATLSDQRIKISKNTNVGIGEDLRPQYPEAKLTINSDPGNTSQPDRITTSVVDSHTGLFLNGTGNAINEKYGLQFGWYSGYSTGGIFVVGDNVAGSTSGDITFDMGDGVSGGALIERMRLTHEGSLGIGTISPLSNSSLDIFGTTGAKGRIATFTLQNSDDPTVAIADGKQTRPSISFSTDNTTGIFGGSGFVALGTSANERMRITSVGNVGIGTDSPTTTLQVGGLDDGNNYDITLGWDAVAGDAVGTKRSALTFKTSQNSVNQEDIYKWDIAMLAATATNGSENFGSDLAFLRSTRSSTDVDAVTMLLSRTGNVGIGTTVPTATLDIKGDGADLFLQSADFKIARIQPRGTGANLDKGLFSLFDGNDEDVRIDTEGNSWFNGGNVGIGTASPGAKLDVNAGTENLAAQFESTDSISEIRIKDDTAYTRLLNVGTQFKIMPNDGSETLILDGNNDSATFAGDVVVNSSNTSGVALTVGGEPGNGIKSQYIFSGTGQRNWQIGMATHASQTLSITPSSAAGNTTFTTPILNLDGSNNSVTFAGDVSLEKSAGSVFNLRRNDTSVIAGDDLGSIFFQGNDPSNPYKSGVAILGQGDGTWSMGSPNVYPSRLVFQTAEQNILKTAMVIKSDQKVGIGTTTPSYTLVVSDNGGSGVEFIPQTTNNRTTLLSYNRSGSAYNTFDFDALDIHFNISGTEKTRINSSGSLEMTGGGAIYGKNYSQSGTSGTTSQVDTGIVGTRSAIYECYVVGNLNAGGSSAYRSVKAGLVMLSTDFNAPNVVTKIGWQTLGHGTGGSGGNEINVVPKLLIPGVGSFTEVNQNIIGTAQIRLEIGAYNSSHVGDAQEVRIIRRI